MITIVFWQLTSMNWNRPRIFRNIISPFNLVMVLMSCASLCLMSTAIIIGQQSELYITLLKLHKMFPKVSLKASTLWKFKSLYISEFQFFHSFLFLTLVNKAHESDGVASDNMEGSNLFIKQNEVEIVLCTKPTLLDMCFTILCWYNEKYNYWTVGCKKLNTFLIKLIVNDSFLWWGTRRWP